MQEAVEEAGAEEGRVESGRVKMGRARWVDLLATELHDEGK